MTGFFKDGRPDTDELTAAEMAVSKQYAEKFAALAAMLERARTVGDCREIDQKVDELMRLGE